MLICVPARTLDRERVETIRLVLRVEDLAALNARQTATGEEIWQHLLPAKRPRVNISRHTHNMHQSMYSLEQFWTVLLIVNKLLVTYLLHCPR